MQEGILYPTLPHGSNAEFLSIKSLLWFAKMKLESLSIKSMNWCPKFADKAQRNSLLDNLLQCTGVAVVEKYELPLWGAMGGTARSSVGGKVEFVLLVISLSG